MDMWKIKKKNARISAGYAKEMASCTLTISLIDWASSCFNFMDNVTFPYPITSEGDLTVMNPGPLVS